MKKLNEIERGKPGWKVRRLQLAILDTMSRATTPQTGWHVYQKIKRSVPADGLEICIRMKYLCEMDYLVRVGFDSDHDSQYELST